MAFNPFEVFRKNSKAMLAVLTIFVMILFVLSTGGGGSDAFEWIARQMGGSDQRGPVLGEVAGNEYYRADLENLRRKRAVANLYMEQAVIKADQNAFQQLDKDLKGGAIKDKQIATNLQTAVSGRAAIAALQTRFEELQRQNSRDFGTLIQLAQELDRTRSEHRAALMFLIRTESTLNEKDNPAEFRAVKRFFRLMFNEERRVERARKGQSYFNDPPNVNDRDALLFAMYLEEADKLGIKFSEDDIKRLVGDETHSMLTPEDANQIDVDVRQRRFGNISYDAMFRAIGDEFRVRTVLMIARGAIPGRDTTPSAMTPYEFYEFYKDRTTPLTFEVIDVPVESFIAKVKEEPDKDQIGKLFDRYKRVPYDPAKGTPGFQKPQEVKLQYVAVDATKPIYKEAVAPLEAASAIAAGLNPTVMGGGAVPGVMTVANAHMAQQFMVMDRVTPRPTLFADMIHTAAHMPPAAGALREIALAVGGYDFDHPVALGLGVAAEQIRSATPHRSIFDMSYQRGELRDTSMFNPVAVAGFVGQLATARHPAGGPGVATFGYQSLSELMEVRDRVRVGIQMIAAPLNPAGVAAEFVVPVRMIATHAANAPPGGEVGRHFVEALALAAKRPERLAQAHLVTLEQRLREIRAEARPKLKPEDAAKKDPPKADPEKIKEANAKAAEAVKKWLEGNKGVIATGGNDKPLDKYALYEDPALKALFEPIKDEENPIEVVTATFFRDAGPGNEGLTLYDPQTIRGFRQFNPRDYSKPVYMAWKTVDVPSVAYTGRLDELPPDRQGEVKAQVVRAWKMEKARKLAKEAADALAADLSSSFRRRDMTNPADRLAFERDLREKLAAGGYTQLTTPIELAPLSKQMSTRPLPKEHPQLQWSEGKVEHKQIKYPPRKTKPTDPPGMAELLLEARTKPAGEALVIPDVPQSHYYVAVLTHKDVPSTTLFAAEVFNRTSPTVSRDRENFYAEFAERSARDDFFKDFTARMKAELGYKETDEMKKAVENRRDEPAE